jgi:hypothetical protein
MNGTENGGEKVLNDPVEKLEALSHRLFESSCEPEGDPIGRPLGHLRNGGHVHLQVSQASPDASQKAPKPMIGAVVRHVADADGTFHIVESVDEIRDVPPVGGGE